jgi:hypothetical protein
MAKMAARKFDEELTQLFKAAPISFEPRFGPRGAPWGS